MPTDLSDIDQKLHTVESILGFRLHDYQEQALRALSDGSNVVLHSPTGCHAPGQSILMFDGTSKDVEDIEVGDLLMGPDSSPRRVRRLIRGFGRMVEIAPVRGDPFVVNEDHILTLVRTGVIRNPPKRSRKKVDLGGGLIDVSVKKWETWSKTQKHIHKLKRTGADFEGLGSLPIDPYMLGVMLGDGSMRGGTPSVTTMDEEILSVVVECAEKRDLRVREDHKEGSKATTYLMSSGHRRQFGRAGGSNSLITDLRGLGLWKHTSGNKFIPHVYKTSSRDKRLRLLAGLIDTDGYNHHNTHEITTKSPQLANDVAFVARSLGFASYIYETKKKSQNGTEGRYYRVSIGGDNATIPCLLDRKQTRPRAQKKDPTRTGFSLRERGLGSFFGFSLTGDGRYLLGDFTITHNSGKTVLFQGAPYVSPHSGVTVILYPLRALVKDQTRRFAEIGLPSVTLYGDTKTKDRPAIYDRILDGSAKLVLTTPESFDKNRKLQSVLAKRGVNVLAVDEAHAYEEWADGFRSSYRRAGYVAKLVGVKQYILCSATLTKKGFDTAAETLDEKDWTVVKVPPIRSNLIYKNLSEPASEILIRAVKGTGLKAPGIVFFTTVKKLNETADYVERRSGVKVLRYNGGMTGKTRREAQDTFMDEDVWIFATKAFGMGIDKDNIRNIVHYQLPNSILSYAQECGRAGRDGEDAGCYLTQTEEGEAAHFLISMSVPSLGLVRKVWQILQEIALDYSGWFHVDWERVAERVRMRLPSVQSCVTWLFTGKMIEKRQKKTAWKFTIHVDSDDRAIKYKRKTPEVIDILRAEAMVGQGPSEFSLKPSELSDSVGQLFVGWRQKLRKMAELGIIEIEEPPKGKASYRFLHNEFHFAQGAEQLKSARSSAFGRLEAMCNMQRAAPSERENLIRDAIALKLVGLPGPRPLPPRTRPDPAPKAPAPEPVTVDPFVEDDGFDDYVPF